MALGTDRPPQSNGGSAPTRQVLVFEQRDGELVRRGDQLAIEEPLEIRLETPAGTSNLTVTMRTPGNDMELVAGWLLAEGIIDGIDDVSNINYCVDAANGGDQRFNVVTANLRVPPRLSGRERMTVTSSACGVCGTASIDALREVGFPSLGSGPRFAFSVLTNLPELLRAGQRSFQVTGAVHGAALIDSTAATVVIREDVGRHNAVDKVVGWAVLNHRMPLADTALVVSGRVSFEIVQKAARAGVSMVVAVSGATSLAVALAEEVGMTVVGFTRGSNCTIYSGPARVVPG
jgi:FdhD protein